MLYETTFRWNILYDNHIYILFGVEVESAQLVLKQVIVHWNVHMIWMSDRWPLCVSAPVVLLSPSSIRTSLGPFTHKGKSEIQKSIFELQSKS